MRTVTFAELKQAVRELADEESSSGGASSLVSDPELGRRINEAIPSYYNLLVEVQGHEYFGRDKEYELVPGQRLYALPLDFFQIMRLVLQYSEWQAEIFPWSQQDTARHENRGMTGAGHWPWLSENLRYRRQGPNLELVPAPRVEGYKLLLRYTPTTPQLANDGDEIDGINGWEKYVYYRAAIDLLDKGETDASPLWRKLGLIKQEIRTHAPNCDAGRPEVVQDTRHDDWSGIGLLPGSWDGYRGW